MCLSMLGESLGRKRSRLGLEDSDDIIPTTKRSFYDTTLDSSIQSFSTHLRRKLMIGDASQDEVNENTSFKRQRNDLDLDDGSDHLTDVEDNIEPMKPEDNLTSFGEIVPFPICRKKKMTQADYLVDDIIRKQRREALFTGVPLDFDSRIPNSVGPHPSADNALSLTIPLPLIISAQDYGRESIWDIDTGSVRSSKPNHPPTLLLGYGSNSSISSNLGDGRSHADCFLDDEVAQACSNADHGTPLEMNSNEEFMVLDEEIDRLEGYDGSGNVSDGSEDAEVVAIIN